MIGHRCILLGGFASGPDSFLGQGIGCEPESLLRDRLLLIALVARRRREKLLLKLFANCLLKVVLRLVPIIDCLFDAVDGLA